MTAATLLAEVARRGGAIEADDGNLILSPAMAMDDALLGEVRRLKPELLRLLAASAGFSTPAVCARCSAPRAPYLFDLAGRSVLLCPTCKRWTVAAGAP
jgi:hypothetical protein